MELMKNCNAESHKSKHFNFKYCMTTQLSLKDGFLAYRIASPINTILNEIRRDKTPEIEQEKYVKMYLADTIDKVKNEPLWLNTWLQVSFNILK